MRTKKIFLLFALAAFVFVGSASALDFGGIIEGLKEIAAGSKTETEQEISQVHPENALTLRPEESVYFVLKLDDTSKFLQWLLSKENINIFMPLILGSESSNEILGAVEIMSAIIQNTPIKSTAVIAGINKADVESKNIFLQAAFSVDPSINSAVKKISDGTADAKDIAKLVLGNANPIASFAESIIKVQREENIFKINNVLFLAAHDGLILLGFSPNDISSSVNALGEEKARLFTGIKRKFDTNDFSMLHIDYGTAADLEPDGELDDLDAGEYFDKPLNIEFAFKRLPDKFTISTALNLREALKKEYADKILKEENEIKKVKGGNIDLKNSGGKDSPLFALGTHLDLSAIKDHPELKTFWEAAARNLRVRFKISESEFENLFNGPLSVVVNDSITVQGFKVPAIYISQTGKKGAAEKFFDKLAKSQHFSKVHDGVLQMDSSLSPVSLLAANKGETFCVDFAELASLTEKPEPAPALEKLMNTESVSAFWLDFTAIQKWVTDDKNGVFSAIAPIAMMTGFGKIFNAARDVVEAKYSVPSVSLWSETPEVFHVNFDIVDVPTEDGFLTKLVSFIKTYIDFQNQEEKK